MGVDVDRLDSALNHVRELANEADYYSDLHSHLAEAVDALEQAVEANTSEFRVTFYVVVQKVVTIHAKDEDHAREMFDNEEYSSYEVEIEDDEVEVNPSGYDVEVEEA